MGIPFNTGQFNKSTMGPAALAGIGAASGLIDNLFNIGQKKKQREHENQLAKYSYDQQRQMIQEQNLYNAPKQQQERFKEAGLNPHLMYGKGTPGLQTQTAKYTPAKQEYGELNLQPAVGQALGDYNQIRLTGAQTDNLRAQTLTQNQLAKNALYTGFGIQADNQKKGIQMPFHSAKAQAEINQMDANINNIGAKTSLTGDQIATEKQRTLKEKAQAEMAREQADYMKEHGRPMPSSIYESTMGKIIKALKMPEVKLRKGKDIWGNPIKP